MLLPHNAKLRATGSGDNRPNDEAYSRCIVTLKSSLSAVLGVTRGTVTGGIIDCYRSQ